MEQELTDEQMEQQDAVDNSICQFIGQLFGKPDEIDYFDADVHEMVGDIRDLLVQLAPKYGVSEMEFYPYLADDEPPVEVLAAREQVEFLRKQTDTFVITRLSRSELTHCGLTEEQCENVPAELLERIASKMADDYVNQLYWSSLEFFGGEILAEWKQEQVSGTVEKV